MAQTTLAHASCTLLLLLCLLLADAEDNRHRITADMICAMKGLIASL
jgi:hypothetical protein